MNIPELLPYFENITQAGSGRYKGSCPMPNHDDSDPSVSITQDVTTGNILLYCWGCNTKGREICQALGLPLSALFGDPGHPSAIRQTAQNVEVSPEDQANLEQRVKVAMGRLDEAKDYIFDRFGLTIEDGRALGLGVDSDFGVSHLIIPFHDPTGKIVGMQGRRLEEGEPRWRSVSGAGWSKMGCFGWEMHHQGPVIICYADDTEVLTSEGWCLLSKLDETVTVAQYEQNSGFVSFVAPSNRQAFPYVGEMVEWDSRWNSLSVTPDHRVLHRNNSTKVEVVTTADKVGPRREFPVAGIKASGTNPGVNVRIAVAFQADGNLIRDGKYLRWSFTKQRKIERLQFLLEEANVPYKLTVDARGDTTIFVSESVRTDLWLPKIWGWDLLDWDLESREIFLDELRYWDGSDTDPNTDTYEYTTSIEQNAEVVCAVAALTGRGSTSTVREREGNRVPQYRVVIINKSWRQSAKLSTRRDYDGSVYCLTVPSGFLVTRRNGNTVISGNCEGPSDALAVVGRAYLPAIAIRGASNTSPEVCEQIRKWLGDKPAIVIGDNDEAGEKFSEAISSGVGIDRWVLPTSYPDLDSYLLDGNVLDEALTLATGTVPEETAQEQSTRLQAVIEADLDQACYNEELKQELNELPTWQLDAILVNCVANAGYGQRTMVRQRVNALQRAIRDIQVPGGHAAPGGGGGGGIHAPIPDDFNPVGLPEIIWNIEDQLHITNHSIRDAMDAYDRGEFYRAASGQYVKIVGDELVPLKEAGVKSMLSEMAHWRIINGQRETGHVPSDAARIITDPSWQCGLPEIKRRVEVPFMLENGEVVSKHGYHEESGIYLLPRTGDFIQVPDVPSIVTEEHVNQAKKILEDVTEGFMFKDQASKSNLIAMTLTSPLRELFRSNPMVPMLTSTAPQSGSGKGTSIRVPLSTCGVGPYSLSTTAYNPDENEFEKKLVGKLLKKSTYIFLDNIRANVSSSVMEQMLTAANYDGRTLGYSEVNSLSTLVLWVCTLQSTGAFNRDLTRRCVPVELVKNYRGKWKHKNIEAYLAEKRGEMIWACFVVARKWLQDGGQKSEVRLDGYGGWTEVIGGILENVLGYEDFLGNLELFRKSQDENAMTIDGVLERWLTIYGETPQPARMAIEDYEDPALHAMLSLHNPSTRQTINALTRLLDSQRGYIINDSHIFEPIGLQPYGHEGSLKQYRAMPLPPDDEDD